tara:strand:- start:4615 stop:5115 length:501 start_codon:yes stop_codon:yes gene_type:complete
MELHMKKLLLLACFAPLAVAANTPIQGTVESKCVIQTDTTGVYGNPSPSELSTSASDGGVVPIVRYDILAADHYKAVISYPDTFASSPELADVTNWTGDVTVGQTSDALMSGFETDKITYNNTVEFDLTVAGSVWFEIDSTADYGYDKSFPAGDYTAMVVAECIAQ